MRKKKILLPILITVMIFIWAFPAFAGGNWAQDKYGWWYVNADGCYPTSAWQQIDGTWYYFKDSGYMATGLVRIKDVDYYLKPSGAMASDEWVELRKEWYYFTKDGAMAKSCWIDNHYYVGKDGIMVKDKVVDGTYIDENGVGEGPDMDTPY
ncbi:MAG: hypothetical protein RSE05_01260 [Clostridium sp.]